MPASTKPIADQVIVITGATSGIGLATAREAARRGETVVVSSRDETDLAEVVADLRSRGAKASHFAADVGDAEAMRQLAVHAVAEFGRIDTWVNNAGTSIYGKSKTFRSPTQSECSRRITGARNAHQSRKRSLGDGDSAARPLGREQARREARREGIHRHAPHGAREGRRARSPRRASATR